MPTKILGVKRNKNGLILCSHNKVIYYCKECGNGKAFCEHGVIRRQCVPCRGAGVCKHNRVKVMCKDCRGGSICCHNKFRNKCADCSPKGVYVSYKNGAKKRGLLFELTFEEYLQFSDSPCQYCESKSVRNGIDRMDNSIGYTFENSAPCCSMCNLMKKNYTVGEFLAHAKRIASFQLKGENKSK